MPIAASRNPAMVSDLTTSTRSVIDQFNAAYSQKDVDAIMALMTDRRIRHLGPGSVQIVCHRLQVLVGARGIAEPQRR